MSAYVRTYYSTIPPFYDVLTRVGSLGAFPRLHQRAAEVLAPRPGDTVLDLGCGTGMLQPFLVERVGPEGRVIGVDASAEMLEAARRRVRRQGWRNVELRLADITTFEPGLAIDGVVFSISLSAIPDCERVLARAASFLEPGGRLVVVDAFMNRGRPIYWLSNLYTRLKAPVVGSNVNNRLRESAADLLDEAQIEVVHAGLYTIISGTAPATAVRPGSTAVHT